MQHRNASEKTVGVLFGILSAVFVAGYVTTNKYIYTHYDISAVDYSLLFAMSGAIYGLISLAVQMNEKNVSLIHRNFKPLVALGVVGSLAVSTFVIGQHYTTAVNASLLVTSTIVATALFSHLLLKERHGRTQYPWIVILFIGLYIGVVGFGSIHLRSGDLIVLGSVMFFGFGNAYSRVLMKRLGSARLVPDVRLVMGGIIAFAIALFHIRNFGLVSDVLPLALVGGLFFWLTMKSFAKAVYLINANNAIILNNGQIFFTSLAGVLILSEDYSLSKFVGSIIAMVSIYFITYKKTGFNN